MGDIIRRGGAWYVRYKDVDGVRRMRASHQPTKELARRFLVEIEARIARGLVGMIEPTPPAPTVAELIERFITEYNRPRIKDLGRYQKEARVALNRVLPLIGKVSADAVQSEDVERVRAVLGKRLAPASVRVSLSFLGVAYSWAVKAKIVPANPVRGVERPSVEPALDFLDKESVQALLRVAELHATGGNLADSMVFACVHFALYTGLRRGEILGLRWRDLDLETRRLTVSRSYSQAPKSGKARHLRLPSVCVPTLTAWKKVCPPTPEGLVFPFIRYGRPIMGAAHHTMGLDKLLSEAGCRPLARPWHALRHTFASNFIMSGGNILTLQKILGHRDLRMTLVYAHLAPDFLGDEMDRLKY